MLDLVNVEVARVVAVELVEEREELLVAQRVGYGGGGRRRWRHVCMGVARPARSAASRAKKILVCFCCVGKY